jgi:hypothetical protein
MMNKTNASVCTAIMSCLAIYCGTASAAPYESRAALPPTQSPTKLVPSLAMNRTVEIELMPQVEYFFKKLSAEKEQVTVDGFTAFKGNDKFLPGKIAVGLSHLLVGMSPTDARFNQYVKEYRDLADLTVNIDNETWGIYYYLSALNKLKNAQLLDQAISPATLAILKQKLDWRVFVNTKDFTLINLPTNYYGVAFSVARLRMLLGWEDASGSDKLLEIALAHYDKYSGKFGYSDETDGEGRFDRYSILLIAEICQRFVDTGLPLTPKLKDLLRNAATVALNIGNADGEGFSFGRSIGPYADTSMLEILSVAAYLDVLTPEEKLYAYAYSSRIAERYVGFWFDPKIISVDMWGKGRRTDTYRGKHRILGENLSLLNQLISTNAMWNKAGFKNIVPATDLQAWFNKTQPTFNLHWFAQGEYDRALAIYRDKNHVFSLLMVNGGPSQHANSPYYPLPFSSNIVSGIADSGYQHPQLLPKFTLKDGSQLIPTAFIKNIRQVTRGKQHKISYQQDALTLLGKNRPIKDKRISLDTQYLFEPGVITRIDKYTPSEMLDVEQISLSFASFSDDASISSNVSGSDVTFKQGNATRFTVSGLAKCRADKTNGNHDFKSNNGPMRTHVYCNKENFKMNRPITIKWVIRYL